MTLYQKLYTGIGRAAWGYFFLYINININTVSLLPAFVGYLLFLSAIGLLREQERELSLLRTLGILLAVWNGGVWLASWGAIELDGMLPMVDILISVISIYFHFQLLTNLASLAAKYQPEGYALDAKLLRYRTLQTIMLTAAAILSTYSKWLGAWATLTAVGVAIVHVIAAILLMMALFELRRCLTGKAEPDAG